MTLSTHDIELIESALDNELSESEMEEFNLKLKSSAEFNKEYEHQRSILAHTVAYKNYKLKKELKELYRDYNDTKSSNSKIRTIALIKYGVAASIVIAILFYFAISNLGPANTQDLYTAYYKPYDGVPLLRGDEQDSLQMALSAYYGNDYEYALDIFLKVDNPKQNLLIGNCYLNLERYEKAEQAFKLQLALGINDDIAQWYLALLYLKQDKKEQAEELLKKIDQGYYHKKAQELLKKF